MSESKINIPNFSYPFKEVNKEEEYYKKLSEKETHGNYLFSKDGFWHGGIHFSDSLTDVKATQGIRAIADGELVAYRINSKYLQNDDEEIELEGLYSNGFFLLRHYFEYPIGNKLTFFSLYMHTAKLSDYDFSTHKMLKKDTIRSVEKYVDSSTGAIENLEKDTKLTLGELNEYGRYQIVQVDGQNRTGICTVDKGSVIPIEDALSLKTININTSTDTIIIPPTPIKIKAGEVIGLVGEYNRSKQINRELLHLEIFTKDDVKSFSDSAKSSYESDTSEDKPKPIKVIIENEKNLYAKICECKLDNNSNIREGFSNDSSKYNNETTVKNTTLEVDLTTQQKVGTYTRVKVLKIDTADVSSDNYTVITNVLTDKKDVFKIISEKSIKKEIVSKDIKIEKDSANEKYLLYSNDSNKYVKYSDCIERHPITFEWATIIDENSSDDISIFENIKKYLLPEFVEDELKINSLYKELFKSIDKDTNGQIEAQELEDASKEKAIKQLTSKYIVKHSSEWDKTINLSNNIKTILEEYKDNIKNYDKIKQHLENEEKRVDKLNFFNECSSIDGFPTTDKVFHINPIGLVGVFGNTSTFDWAKTPIVKLITSKESKGSYSAYNITGWKGGIINMQNFKVYESHFKAEGTYKIETMTIQEIKTAQTTYIGTEKKHLFAVGLFQMITNTLNSFLSWLKTKKKINESTQLFNKEFQDLMPLYFWESKQNGEIGKYFKDKLSVEKAAYAVSREWASAGVPKGEKLKNGTVSDGTKKSYYDGDGANNAHYTATETIKALEETKKMLDQAGGYKTVLRNGLESLKDK